MKGRIIMTAVMGVAMSHAAAAGTTVRRDGCQRVEKAQPQEAQRPQRATQQPRVRGRLVDCRIQKAIPAVVDPTPYFLL